MATTMQQQQAGVGTRGAGGPARRLGTATSLWRPISPPSRSGTRSPRGRSRSSATSRRRGSPDPAAWSTGPSDGGSGTRARDARRRDAVMLAAPTKPRAEPAIDGAGLKAKVAEILNRRPAVGLAVGVVRNGSLEFFHGHGVADIGSKTPVIEDTVFRIASISKTFTAIAVMQLWEQGLVDLDAPANRYLRAYRLVPAKASFGPATVRQLLTHTAGIAEVVHPSGLLRPLFGESVKVGRPMPSLADYYRRGLRIQAEPGTRFTYTDHGFATLGQLVEDVSGKALDRYLRERVFEPLGMANTDLVRSELVRSHLATGYKLGSHGARAVTGYEVVTAGAGSVYSTTGDMARYVAALLGGGTCEHGSMLEPATLATMFQPHYQPDPRIPGMGLAFWRGTV